ncbi:hypothetical protein D3C87_1588210 [compost metagenome]
MKILLTLISLCIILIGCKSEKEKEGQLITKEINRHLEDLAFKNNSKLNIHEFKLIQVDTVNENTLDSARSNAYLDKISEFNQRKADINKIMSLQLRQLRLLGEIDRGGSLWENTKEKLQDLQSEFKSLEDSTSTYFEKDSLLLKTIKGRTSPKKIYEAKVFLKLTTEKEAKSHNIMDTVFYQFDETYKIIK